MRVGRIAARITWAVAAVALVALAGVQGLIAVLSAGSLPGTGFRHTTVLTSIVVLLLACALACLACAPGCAARALRRRLPVRGARHPRLLLVGETATRVLAGACLVVAALWAHDVQHYDNGAGGLPAGTAAGLAPIGLHPAALIVAGLAAAALSLRWSRARHRARVVSRRTPRSAGTSR